MEITITLSNIDNVGLLSEEEIAGFSEIFSALVQSGGLTGVKSGKTVLHFDHLGIFQGIQLDYMPWRRRKSPD